jgi:hypothetical protein
MCRLGLLNFMRCMSFASDIYTLYVSLMPEGLEDSVVESLNDEDATKYSVTPCKKVIS